MNQKSFLTILPLLFLLCLCIFLSSLYIIYRNDKDNDFFDVSNEGCQYKDEVLNLELNHPCSWGVYNGGISYIDKEYNDALVIDTLNFFQSENDVEVQIIKAETQGSYFILNQDYTFEDINDKIVIYNKENYDLYRIAAKADCNELEEMKYVNTSNFDNCARTMFVDKNEEISLKIRVEENSEEVKELIEGLLVLE